MPGILMCNAQIVFMMMAADYVAKAAPANIMAVSGGFVGLIFVLTLNFMLICYKVKAKK